MNRWERFNHTVAIPMFGSLTLFRRRITRPLLVLLHKGMSQGERERWLKHPANMRFEQRLRHWVPEGPQTYECGVVRAGREGRSSVYLRSRKASAHPPATLRQTIKADNYRGKQLRFSGEVKVEQVEEQAGLYIRTSTRPAHERLRPENVVRGTHDWMRYEATVPVAEDALFIRFGLLLKGSGQLWLRDAQLEVVEP